MEFTKQPSLELAIAIAFVLYSLANGVCIQEEEGGPVQCCDQRELGGSLLCCPGTNGSGRIASRRLINLFATVTSTVKRQETAVPTFKVSRNHVALEKVSTV